MNEAGHRPGSFTPHGSDHWISNPPRACRLVLTHRGRWGVRRIAGSYLAAAVRQYRDRIGIAAVGQPQSWQ
jgi:hypothetical protein